MTTNMKTVNVRIKNSTHEELKELCDQEGMLIGRLVDKVLTHYINDWKTNINTDRTTPKPITSD